MAPSLPEGIVEARDDVGRNAEGERLWPAQIGARRACGRQSVGKIETNQLGLHGWRREGDQGNHAIAEVKFRIEPEIVLYVVIGRTIRGAKFQGVRALGPGYVVLELIAPLVSLIGKQSGSSICAGAAGPGRIQAKAAQAEIDSVVVQRNRFGTVPWNDLNEHLVVRIAIDIAVPGGEDAEVPHEQRVAFG